MSPENNAEAQLKEMTRERDEFRALAEASEARVAALREVVEDAVDAAVQWVVDADANNPRDVASLEAYRKAMGASAEAQRVRSRTWEAALSAAPTAWLEAHDRKVAASAWNLGHYCGANPEASYDAKTQRGIDIDYVIKDKR